jgi:hypothetical protein
MKILMPLYPCEGCCDQCYALDDLRVFFDTAYCEYCWGELSESNWPLWNDAGGAVAGAVLSDAELDAIDEGFDAITYRALGFVGYPKHDEMTAHATVLRSLLERAKQ